MKSSAKATSFHVAARGNFPTARDLAELNTYTTPRRGRRRKKMINQNDQSIINGPPTGHPDIESTPFPQRAIRGASRHHGTERYERSGEQVIANEPRAIRRASRRQGAANDLLRKPTDSPSTHLMSNRAIRLSAASGMTVDREGDGRIREELESLGGR